MVRTFAAAVVLTSALMLEIRLTEAAAGDLDPTFGNGGKVTTDFSNTSDTANGVVIQPDGKIVAAGGGDSTIGSIAVSRYNPNGALDTTFDGDGKASTAAVISVYGTGREVALQSDGKIVVAGEGGPVGQSDFDFILVRFNSNGSLDTTFNSSGIVVTRFSTNDDDAYAIAIQPDGKIVVGGQTFITGGSSVFALARYNSNGTLDTTFGDNGKLTTTFAAFGNRVESLLIQDDNKIIAAGVRNLARYLPDGTLDATFGTGGRVLVNLSGLSIKAAALQPDGNIVIAGAATPVQFLDFAVIRLTSEGVFDTTFNMNGRAFLDFGTTNDHAESLLLQPDGKIVLVGYSGILEGSDFALARFNANGSTDTSFGDLGKLTTDFLNGNDVANGAAIQTDGKIVAVGRSGLNSPPADFAVARYLSDGTAVVPRPHQFDFDGDLKDDFSVFRPTGGVWFIQQSTDGSVVANWGLAGDHLTPADFDGDGKTDIAVWREGAQSTFFILESATNAVRIEEFGTVGDTPIVVGDFDGDGSADPAVYREGTQGFYFYRGSLNNPGGNITFVPWGTTGDRPVRGDFDGDGVQDAAIFRPSSAVWFIRRSSDGNQQTGFWGLASDTIVNGDFDADGKSDLAVFRPSNGVWYILQSSNGQPVFQQWGLATDILVPADYDGDGRADVAVWRPSDGSFWVLQSGTGTASIFNFGLDGDVPIPSAFTP